METLGGGRSWSVGYQVLSEARRALDADELETRDSDWRPTAVGTTPSAALAEAAKRQDAMTVLSASAGHEGPHRSRAVLGHAMMRLSSFTSFEKALGHPNLETSKRLTEK
eukprot:1464316-Rhodomonas_salina.1